MFVSAPSSVKTGMAPTNEHPQDVNALFLLLARCRDSISFGSSAFTQPIFPALAQMLATMVSLGMDLFVMVLLPT